MSRFEDILQSIVDGGDPSELQPPESRNEVLLQAVHTKMTANEATIAGHTTQLAEKANLADMVEDSNNKLNLYDINHLTDHAFDGSTGAIKTDTNYDLTGYIPLNDAVKVIIAKNGAEPNGTYFQFMYFGWYTNAGVWISKTTPYVSGGVTPPENAAFLRLQYYSTTSIINQINLNTLAAYDVYYHRFAPEYNDGTMYMPQGLVSYGDSIAQQGKWQPFVLAKFKGMTHTNLGVGSTTMTYDAAREAEFPCMVNAARVAAIQAANPDIITIGAGTNDAHTEQAIGTNAGLSAAIESKDKATFYGALSWLIETLLTWKPTLKIVLLTPIQGTYQDYYTNTYVEFGTAMKEIAGYYSLRCVDLYHECGISLYNKAAYMDESGIHPNDAGGRLYAQPIVAAFKVLYGA